MKLTSIKTRCKNSPSTVYVLDVVTDVFWPN